MAWRGILFFIFGLSICGCNHPVNETTEAEKIVQSSGSADFRHVNIGDPLSEVIRNEGEHMVYRMPDELMYRIPLDQKDSTYFEVTYNFNEEGLYNIVLEIFPRDEVQQGELNSDFITYYTSKYGEMQRNDEGSEWKVMTTEGRFIRVLISDVREKNDRPCLKIFFDEYN